MIVNSSKAFSSLGQIIYVIAWREGQHYFLFLQPEGRKVARAIRTGQEIELSINWWEEIKGWPVLPLFGYYNTHLRDWLVKVV